MSARFQGFLSNLLTPETTKCHLCIVLSEGLYHLYILAHSIENANLVERGHKAHLIYSVIMASDFAHSPCSAILLLRGKENNVALYSLFYVHHGSPCPS